MRTALVIVVACLALVASPVAVADSPSDEGGKCVYTSGSGTSTSAYVSPSDCKGQGGAWDPDA